MLARIMKPFLYILVAAVFAASGVAQAADSKESVTLTGVLKTGMMRIGGETTGTVLAYADKQGHAQTIEVEVTPQTKGAELAKDGASLSITGEIVVHHYVERGDVSRIVATEIAPN
jgi:hypothetical protein